MKRGRSRFPSQKKFQVAILTKGYLLIRGINKTRIRIYIDKSKAVCTGGSAKSYLHPPAKGREKEMIKRLFRNRENSKYSKYETFFSIQRLVNLIKRIFPLVYFIQFISSYSNELNLDK